MNRSCFQRDFAGFISLFLSERPVVAKRFVLEVEREFFFGQEASLQFFADQLLLWILADEDQFI